VFIAVYYLVFGAVVPKKALYIRYSQYEEYIYEEYPHSYQPLC